MALPKLDCRNGYVGDVFHDIQIPDPLPLTGGPSLVSKVFMASEEELAESMLAWCGKQESLPREVVPLQQPASCLTVLQRQQEDIKGAKITRRKELAQEEVSP